MTADTSNAEARRLVAAEQAAAWLVELRTGQMSVKERGEFVDWLRESPMHIAEMLKVNQVDQALEGFSHWGEVPMTERGPDNVVQLLPEMSHTVPRRRQYVTSLRAVAAGVAVAIVAVGTWFSLHEKTTIVRTQLAERREMTLEDGSVVTIAPVSELRIGFRRDQRSVELLEGHALFNVAKDSRRPFVVRAGATTVRAVGTSFDVERAAGNVRVTVVEGRVLVARRDRTRQGSGISPSATTDQVFVSANEEVVVSDEAPMPTVRHVNAAAQATWVTGTLAFEDETVAEVVRRFNLHNRAQIQILDPNLAGRRISGTFKASDPESFVDFIRATGTDENHGGPAIRLDWRSQ
ncbi:MAG: FecR domain-containing protein [Steroidobacteraceae bacterium]